MKKLILLFGIILMITACRNEKSTEKDIHENSISDTLTYQYDSVKVLSKNHLKMENNLGDTTKAIITYPVFTNTSLNTYIERKVTDYYGENEQPFTYKYLANSFVKGYDEFFAEKKEVFQDWFLIIDIKVLKQKNDYIALQYLHSDYSGGAHPNTNIVFINYNHRLNQPITLDSLVEASKIAELTTIGEAIFRKNESLSPTSNLESEYFFENGKFFLPQNFYIGDKGLVFLYNPYEIKPYVAGTTELIIPFNSLKDIVKPNTILSSYN